MSLSAPQGPLPWTYSSSKPDLTLWMGLSQQSRLLCSSALAGLVVSACPSLFEKSSEAVPWSLILSTQEGQTE